MNLLHVPPFPDHRLLRVVIETPKGSRNKFDYDPELKAVRLAKNGGFGSAVICGWGGSDVDFPVRDREWHRCSLRFPARWPDGTVRKYHPSSFHERACQSPCHHPGRPSLRSARGPAPGHAPFSQ
jgi:hypothetical protein